MAELKNAMLKYDKMFDEAFPGIVDQLVTEDEANPDIHQAAVLLRECLNYNTFDGKKSRGKMVYCVLYFLSGGKPSPCDVDNAIHLGWCVEILQAFLLVADDIMDKSDLRRGKPCWYKKVGCTAINDTYLLEQCVYKIIDKKFSTQPFLLDVYRHFHNITYLTGMGQELDMFISENPCLDNYTLDRYEAIVKYKTAYYSFYFPVILGMILAGVKDATLLKEVEPILLEIGKYFQIQDDYLDCYGDPAITGKVGRDIEDRKCSWLVVQALKIGTEEDRAILDHHYGKEDALSVGIVKELFQKLQLDKQYFAYEEESYGNICKLIKNQRSGFPKPLFFFLVQKIYKRQK